MQIKSLKLENIRSYTNQEIVFPEGSTLLSGDIGSGKSSILLAMEFALFGIMKGDLSGAALLRHGAKQGSVELKFNLDSRDIIIKRYLKRGADSISQEAGFILDGEKKQDGTAIELKAKMLELLGYPKELLTKSKSLIYRYTVYTPQEDMKKILTEDNEHRLNTLRKVFGIDKYKQIIENTSIVTRNLRENKKELEGKISDLPEKEKQKQEYQTQIESTKLKLSEVEPKAEQIRLQKEGKKSEIERTEQEIQRLNLLKKELASLTSSLNEKIERNQKIAEDLQRTEDEIILLKDKCKPEKVEELKNTIGNEEELKNKIKEVEENITKLNGSIKEYEINKTNSEKIKNQIVSLDNCPTCFQTDSGESKNKINETEDGKIKSNSDLLTKSFEEKGIKDQELTKLKGDFDKIIENKNILTKLQAEFASLNEKNNNKLELVQEKDQIKGEVAEINTKKTELNQKIEEQKDISEVHERIKKEFEDILTKERDVEIEKARYNKEIENFTGITQTLEQEIQTKILSKGKLQKLAQLQLWLDEYFVNLMKTMEKKIMSRVYHEFDELFQDWFNALIEDEMLNVRLDEQFSPVISQNGFETELTNLSGGEKTSIALAYRLSLNKVINDIVSGIKTKDLIILDEPTDGFSSEQLDKIRDVLDQLNTKQTIIVSHEPKIEGFVDNILRINKNEHMSKID